MPAWQSVVFGFFKALNIGFAGRVLCEALAAGGSTNGRCAQWLNIGAEYNCSGYSDDYYPKAHVRRLSLFISLDAFGVKKVARIFEVD